MADEKAYEQKLVNDTVASLLADKNAKAFTKAVSSRTTLISKISARVEFLSHAKRSEAETVIDFKTGKFKGARFMPHLLDEQLKGYFVELEKVTKEINKHPYKSSSEALKDAETKLATFKQTVATIKSVFGIDKARVICANAKARAIQITGIQF